MGFQSPSATGPFAKRAPTVTAHPNLVASYNPSFPLVSHTIPV